MFLRILESRDQIRLRDKRFLRVESKEVLKIKGFSDHLLVQRQSYNLGESGNQVRHFLAIETDYLVCIEVKSFSVRQ